MGLSGIIRQSWFFGYQVGALAPKYQLFESTLALVKPVSSAVDERQGESLTPFGVREKKLIFPPRPMKAAKASKGSTLAQNEGRQRKIRG